MENILNYLRISYPSNRSYAYYFEAAMEELTALVNEVGVKETRKRIREARGTCPLIVKLWPEDTYTFKKCAYTVYVNDEVKYMSRYQYRLDYIVDNDTAYALSRRYTNGCYQYYSQHNIYYSGYDLSVWISHGEICEECGVAFIPQTGEHLCASCNALYQPLPYNTRIEEMLPTEDTKDVLMGIELEYEQLTAKDVACSLKGHALAKRDSSILNGVEVVTRPASLKTHKEKLQNFYKSCKVAAASNTGMHVHIDKKRLSNYQIGFMLEFLNKGELIPHIELIAGRPYSTNTYCRADSSKKMTWGLSSVEYTFDKRLYQSRTPTNKYSPFNTGKEKTVEIRIFASPNSYEECVARLDFVNALIHYSSPYSISVKSLKDKFNWDTFKAFIVANRKEFPDFYNYFLKGSV